MHQLLRVTLWSFVLATPVVGLSTLPDEWSEEAFRQQQGGPRFHFVRESSDPSDSHTVVGETSFYELRDDDTLLDVARFFSLGQTEILEANPGLQKFGPPVGQLILLPTQWVLPDTEFKGLKINIPEMRLYYFRTSEDGTAIVATFPVGLGRDDWRTPHGAFRVRGKTANPTWVLPESIKKEMRKAGEPAPDKILGGSPDNPLGEYRLELTIPSYAIHGTNMPWGVGMQVSHGCVRLYPEDIARLFPVVEVGVPGEFLYQPVKVGARSGRIYVEVHKDIYTLAPALYRQAIDLIDRNGWRSRVDLDRLRVAVSEQSGVPFDVTAAEGNVEIKDERVKVVADQFPAAPTDPKD